MKEVQPFEGVLSLRRFKEFFLKNQIDFRTIRSTIQCIEAEFSQWKSVSSISIPKIWVQAVQTSKKWLQENYKEYRECKGIFFG